MGSRLSKLKHASSAVVLLRGKRRFNHRRSMSNDTALTQVDVSSSHPQHQHHHDASHRLSQMTARTSTTDPDTVLKRFSTPEELSEADRFDHQHYFLQQVTGLTMHVPIERPRRCLDLATGTGIWVLETSGLFPKCEFLGVDVNSRSLPGDLMPSNCRFEQVDITKHLPFANDSFDYIRHHWLPLSTIPIRNSSSCHHNCSGSCHGAMLERKLNRSGTTPATQRQSSSNDWELHLGRCYNVCAPGGWLELMGTDAYIHNGSFVAHRFNNWMNAIEQKRRARLRRNSGVKEKRGSNSSAKYGGSIPGTTATAWPAFYSPTTPSVDSASSTPVMSSSLPTAAPISSIAIASSELPSAAGSNPHITTTNTTTTAESTASSRLILQMLEGGWRDIRHRSWSVPLGGSDSLGMASWRYITSLVASRRSEFIELIREEIQRNEANLASLMATNVQRPMQAQTDPPR
ncbi:hypothetical protein BDF22DRAFT_745086 [Syncephalis plumigaleata]|nr:hypothetical protein BDF22DRAFT_745086 [Syncephalis plumigaleata]